jgi:hypothetical protein
MSLTTELSELFARDLKRLKQEVGAFPNDGLLWQALPGITNSAGNLTLHLEGNLRDYIGLSLGGVHFVRNRDFEFGGGGLTREDLAERIAEVEKIVPPVVAKLTADDLAQVFPREPWGHPIHTGQFLLHLLGHLNYHTGQIDYLRRALTSHGAIPLASLK